MSDPTAWQSDSATGLFYRRVTADESRDNGWHERGLLIVFPSGRSSFPAKVTSGASTATLPVVFAVAPGEQATETLDIVSVYLSRQGSHELTTVVETVVSAAGVDVTASRPTFWFYANRGFDFEDLPDIAVWGWGDERGGIVMHGATDERIFTLRGPYPATGGPAVFDIAPPGGSDVYLLESGFGSDAAIQGITRSTGPEATGLADGEAVHVQFGLSSPTPHSIAATQRVGQCADDLDNDPEGNADDCDWECVPHPDYGGLSFDTVHDFEYTKDVAVVGEARLCNRLGPVLGTAVLHDIGSAATEILTKTDVPAQYDLGTRAPPFRLRHVDCFYLASKTDADNCDAMGGTACPQGYPFANAQADFAKYRSKAWDAFDLTAQKAEDEGEAVFPVSLVGVVVWNAISTDWGWGGYDPTNGFSNLGAAVIKFNWTFAGAPEDPDYLLDGQRLAHEFAHCLGLRHDTAWGPGQARGFMQVPPGPAPILNDDNSGTVFIEGEDPMNPPSNYEIWAEWPWKKDHPRSAGFKYTGCTENPDSCADVLQGWECAPLFGGPLACREGS